MIDGKLQVATVFSGIGAFEQALLKLNLSDTIDFLNNCSSEELYWVSELFERLSEHFKSQKLIECMEKNEKRTGIDCSINIEYAKAALNY